MLKSISVAAAVFIFTALAETAIFSNLAFLPVVPDFVLICSLYFSLVNGRGFGAGSGFISGIVLDFLTGVPFGFNSLFRTVLGYASGFLSGTVNFSGFFMPCLMGFFATIAKYFSIWIITLFYPSILVNLTVFSIPFAAELVFNTVLTPFIFKFLNSFRRMIMLHPEESF